MSATMPVIQLVTAPAILPVIQPVIVPVILLASVEVHIE